MYSFLTEQCIWFNSFLIATILSLGYWSMKIWWHDQNFIGPTLFWAADCFMEFWNCRFSSFMPATFLTGNSLILKVTNTNGNRTIDSGYEDLINSREFLKVLIVWFVLRVALSDKGLGVKRRHLPNYSEYCYSTSG